MLQNLTVEQFFNRFNFLPEHVTLMCTQYKKQITVDTLEEVGALLNKYGTLPVVDFLICNPGNAVILSVKDL